MTKLFRTTSTAALIALVAAAPVASFAQSTATQTTPKAETSATADTGSASTTTTAEGDTMAPAGDDSTGLAQDSVAADGTDVQTADADQAKPVEGQITMQDDNTILADDLIGSTVYTPDEKTVGNIDDLIISMDGGVKGVVIGVGGFLGMGEKHVAIEMASLDVQNDEAGSPRLVTTATKADLEAAPAFMTKADQKKAGDAAGMSSGGTGADMTGTGSADTTTTETK
ncbi:PRC-barrel domain-containing protein [Pseudooceanicola sp. CBS1P-1]|uniref:PRC-barrel domain-containing protein n=1 Tax=Pseudooceanicola albus TaxID=2692189 RepID=A0A6L7G4U8_9RHOB|nr:MULTISPECIES: PRC-barrel domain-containing protein [Pseudooceanicola]MBT9384699.1 PRC-barrel domain-containing protein [Pseudooceanicola endophyticus]MXN18400.1 hypothetical protein [Pseudooceanicola albus]